MKKRTFLQAILASSGAAFASGSLLRSGRLFAAELDALSSDPAASALAMPGSSAQAEFELGRLQQHELQAGYKHGERSLSNETIAQLPVDSVDAYLEKIRNFDAHFSGDVFISPSRLGLLQQTLARLERVQSYVGHANFNLLGFDDMLFYARNYAPIGGAFEKAELDFMEEIFHADAAAYGFFGARITPDLNHRIDSRDVEKVGDNGHYLLRGESLNHYLHIARDVGAQLQLTSGIRNNVKQMHLFLAKAQLSNGNLSKASRSLAPPGYSFHNAGDFDVGKTGLGVLNFTADFSHTDEFRRLISLGYVDIRYTDSNVYGVRYEPWHIKLNCSENAHTCA